MDKSSESNLSEGYSNASMEVSPMAFTIEFDDQKIDENKKSKIHERLNAFALKHRRNPSLPDFGVVKNAKTNSPVEKLPSPLSSQVPTLGKISQRAGCQSEGYFSSDQDEALMLKNKSHRTSQMKISPSDERKSSQVNGVIDNLPNCLKNSRRSSLNDIEAHKLSCQDKLPIKVEFKIVQNGSEKNMIDTENKSDTVSEAGTYTVDKEEMEEKNLDLTHTVGENDVSEEESEAVKENTNYHHKWINDWVCKVAEQNFLHPVGNDPPPIVTKTSGSGSSSPGASKIPSPINTLPNKAKGKMFKGIDDKTFSAKPNGSLQHRRSSSLSAKECSDTRTSDSSLETESFLRTTESVVTAMQNRMRFSLDSKNDPRKPDRRDYNVKERPHPPSTASDTDTNSDNEGKVFKKPIGNPFTSARLNRAFSLRRAKAEPDTDRSSDSSKKKPVVLGKEAETKRSAASTRSTPSPNLVKSKPPITSPFSRTDCGRFSMRSTVNTPKLTLPNNNQKKDTKKTNANGRSNSSLSSREVEFQNWKRRKSFDPMKAAAEGRKKELAKKAAMNQTMTQSVNLGTTIRTRSGNPVLRSASFHSTPQQVLDSEDNDPEEFQEQISPEEPDEPCLTSWISNQPVLPHNSPSRSFTKCTLITRAPVCSSRCSLSSIVSETHSSPSHRPRTEVLDNLVMTAINDLSYKLKLKSCNLLKKLHYLYDADEERSDRLRNEISILENRRNSNESSPVHQSASRDLSSILKNLKCMENVLKVLDDVLFDENLEVYIEN